MRYRPTAALVRAAVLAALAVIVAVLTAQPHLLVIGAPLVVWSVMSVFRRPPAGEEAPHARLTAHRLAVGETVELTARTSVAERTIDLRMDPVLDAVYRPRWGAVCATDEPVRVRVRATRWGRIELPAPQVRVTDSWGMWAATTRIRGENLAVAVARDAPGRGDTLPHPIGIAGLHHSPRLGDGSALADIRLFRAGDRLSRINWPVTARTGGLHTNATHAERDTDVLVVLDTLSDATTADLAPGTPFASSLDTTVAAAVAVTEHYLHLGDRVGLHDLGPLVGSVPPRAGARQFTALSERLAHAQTGVDPWPRARPVTRLRPGTFAVVCSALLDARVLDEIVRLAHRGATVVVVDTLPAALGAPQPAAGRGSRGRSIWWDEAWALRRLEREVDLRRLRRLGIPVAPWQGVAAVAALAASLAAGRSGARLRPGATVAGAP
ncbi:DUF58 domain-containing protein [Microbacterium fluvii]|uniref:DUF58 domain-containing protein n=1 Tax=Microbacterium fluvii TaxID=415215 RepID=A0ABW2HEX0_9MICO|nr:DUF58 domain-containing protein [Microbacterium fluvii]MCU4671927.1 DUF58 domain-containing protein [Microbacterium fluvii]